MIFVYRTINVVNAKFIVINTCDESTVSSQVKKSAAIFCIFSREKSWSNKKMQEPDMKSTEPESVPVLENFQENVELPAVAIRENAHPVGRNASASS